MADRQKLEQVLDLLINEDQDQDKATELLHQYMVERAREVYESLLEDEDEDFADEIEDDMSEIENDEVGDLDDEEPGMDDMEGDMDDVEDDMDDMEGDTEDRIEDLESALADLRAEFDRLMSDEDDMDMDDEVMNMDDEGSDEFEFDADDEEKLVDGYDYVEEATNLQDPVADPGMGTEGKFAGTGAKSKNGSVNKESPYTRMSPRTTDGEPTDFVGKDETGEKVEKAKDHTPSSNVDVSQSAVKHGHDAQKGEGKYSGTGKGSKNGSVNTKSALGSSNSPKGK